MDNSFDPATDDVESLAGGALEHDVVVPLQVAGHLLASVLERDDLDETLHARVSLVSDALERIRTHGLHIAGALRLPGESTARRVDLGGLVRMAWGERPAGSVDASLSVSRDEDVAEFVLADVDLFVAVLLDVFRFVDVGTTPSSPGPVNVHVSVSTEPDGLAVSVSDDGSVVTAHRRHALGSLCLARAARIVGHSVMIVDSETAVTTTVSIPDRIARGTP